MHFNKINQNRVLLILFSVLTIINIIVLYKNTTQYAVPSAKSQELENIVVDKAEIISQNFFKQSSGNNEIESNFRSIEIFPNPDLSYEKFGAGKTEENCEFMVIVRTSNSSIFIEEWVAYYLVQGASFIHILDYSINSLVKSKLLNYIEAGTVVYERSATKFNTKSQEIDLHNLAMKYVKEFHNSKTPKWMLSVDDDEFVSQTSKRVDPRSTHHVLISKPNDSLRDYLCSTEVLKYKSVNFKWRFVGTSNIKSYTEMNGKTDLETFVKMQRAKPKRLAKGKAAFQISHSDISVHIWDYHGTGISGAKNNKRVGGPLFMHGTIVVDMFDEKEKTYKVGISKWLGKYATLVSGYTYHLSRTKEQLYSRVNGWSLKESRLIKQKDVVNKDNNEVVDFTLYRWVNKVKAVLQLQNKSLVEVKQIVATTPFKQPLEREMIETK